MQYLRHTKKLFIVYLRFKFNIFIILFGSPMEAIRSLFLIYIKSKIDVF